MSKQRIPARIPGITSLRIGASVKSTVFNLEPEEGQNIFTLWPEM